MERKSVREMKGRKGWREERKEEKKKGWVRLEEDLNRVAPWAIVPWPCWLH